MLTTGPEELEQKAASFNPQLIVSNRSRMMIHTPPIAWIKIPTDDPAKPTEIWLEEGRREAVEPGADVVGLLAQVIDMAEEKLTVARGPNDLLARLERSGSSIRHPDRAMPNTDPDMTSSRHFFPPLQS